MNSSWRAEVFSETSTKSMAIVGTSAMMILLRELATERSVFRSSNLITYLLSSRILTSGSLNPETPKDLEGTEVAHWFAVN